MQTVEVSGTQRHSPETRQGLRMPLWSSQTEWKVQRAVVREVTGGSSGEPGLDLPSQDALGSISITGPRPPAGQGAWELHTAGHLHQGFRLCGSCAEDICSRQISSVLDSTGSGSRASQQGGPTLGPRGLGPRRAQL